MKRIISLILVIVAIVSAVNAVADTEALFSANVPVSKQGLFRVDPDTSSIGLSRCDEVTVQTSVAQYADGGWVVGSKSASDLLIISMMSQVEVWDFKVLDTSTWPSEAKSLDGQDLVTWIMSMITRLVYTDGKVYTTLNAEPYKEGVHKAQAEIQLSSKKAQYWTIYRRTSDGIWTLCTKTAKSGNQGQQHHEEHPHHEEARPVDPGRDPEPPAEEETPVAVPVDPGRDGDDNGDGGNTNPIIETSESTSTGFVVVGDGLDDDDNGDGGYYNPLAAPQDTGRDAAPQESASGNPLATPTDTGRD